MTLISAKQCTSRGVMEAVEIYNTINHLKPVFPHPAT